MNRKHNPWVALVALLLLVTILVMACTGCAASAAASTTEEAETGNGPRFTTELAGLNLRIITDNETGVQYLVYLYGSNGAGLTVLQPGEE